MKIVLHGFGAYPQALRHLVELARVQAPEIAWATILPTPHHLRLMRQVLSDDDILSLEAHQARRIRPLADGAALASYAGNFFADIEAEKRVFKHRPAWEQVARAFEIYRIYKAFLGRVRPTHLLLPQIEGFEGLALIAVGRELGAQIMVPVNGRNLGGSYFSAGAEESLPPHRSVSPELLERARAILERFRADGIPAAPPVPPREGDEQLADFRRPLAARALFFLRRSLARPELFERDHLRAAFLNNLPAVRDAWWRRRVAIAARAFDCDRLEDLPARFIYYPLQVTPESSINTPAPYFVDQLRAIDAIRMAMPNDHLLVVKEHPAAIEVRPTAVVRALRRRAGIVVAHYRMSSRALIERAKCTISVTGTATLEAFLLGRPSLTLGPNMIAEYLGGSCPIDALGPRLREAMARPPGDDQILRAIAEILSVSYDFVCFTPGMAGEPMLRRKNLENFLAALRDHAARTGAVARNVAE
ncbi:MAG TPA: hypothetical protein VN832_13890 [Stellaceae bacterium]|nr:hypothetical protein [Stellaceae bacterium]